MWYLSFDCATKTFAFSLCWVDLDGLAAAGPKLDKYGILLRRARAGPPEEAATVVAPLMQAVKKLDDYTRSRIRIVDGDTVDLLPGRTDSEIGSVERIKAAAVYISDRVIPSITKNVPPDEGLRVVVEHQMSANAQARKIAYAIVGILAKYDTTIVGPSLKNSVAVSADGWYHKFAPKYANAYGANKAHALYNFKKAEELFGTSIPPLSPPALRGHIADSFMQVLGLIRAQKINGDGVLSLY